MVFAFCQGEIIIPEKLINPAFGLFLVAAVILAGFMIYKMAQSIDHASYMINLCQTNGYASHIAINYHDYCYRLEGDGGQLILADALEDRSTTDD